MLPASGSTTPARRPSRVDLPEPFSPMTARTLPGGATRSTPSTTGRPAYALARSRATSARPARVARTGGRREDGLVTGSPVDEGMHLPGGASGAGRVDGQL